MIKGVIEVNLKGARQSNTSRELRNGNTKGSQRVAVERAKERNKYRIVSWVRGISIHAITSNIGTNCQTEWEK